MTIAFNAIPIDLRTPGQYLEFDASKAISGLPAAPQRILVIGQKLAAGSAAAGVAARVVSADQAVQLFGRGSMLAQMFKVLKDANAETETWALPLTDAGGGVAASGSIALAGTATAAGVLSVYIGGRPIKVAVASGATAATVATALNGAINADLDGFVTSTVAAGTVTLAARHKGVLGNDIDVRTNLYADEALPAGITPTITALTGGATNPDITAVFTAIGDAPYQTFVLPYTDTANLTAMETELASRWGPMRQIEGMAFGAARGSQGTLASLGGGRNSLHLSILGFAGSPTPVWLWAAAYAGVVSSHGAIDPARPFQTLALPGLVAPGEASRFTRIERDLLLRDGISTFVVDGGGQVLLERPITTYQTNGFGLDDVTFLDVNTPLTLAYVRYAIRARIAAKFPRHKLASDGTQYGPGQAVVTPNIIRAELIALMRELEDAGLVEDVEGFKGDLLVQRDANDKNRVNALIPPNLINQFRVLAGRVEFRL